MLVPLCPNTRLTPWRNDLAFLTHSRGVFCLAIYWTPIAPCLILPTALEASGGHGTRSVCFHHSSLPSTHLHRQSCPWTLNKQIVLFYQNRSVGKFSLHCSYLHIFTKRKDWASPLTTLAGGGKAGALAECFLHTGVFTLRSYLFLTSNLL